MKPKVAVYVPTKNRFSLAVAAVESVIGQTYENIEVIIVDDNSDLNNYQKLEQWVSGRKNVRLLRNDRAPGACGARNTAILATDADYLTGLDDDDLFESSRVETLVREAIQGNCAVCTNYTEVLEGTTRRRNLSLGGPGDITLDAMLAKNVVGNQVLAKRTHFLKAGLFDESQRCWQDYELWVRFIKSGVLIKKISDFSYLINVSDTRPRITNSPNNEGVLQFIEKNSALMSARVRANHLVSFHQREGNPLRMQAVLLCLRPGLWGALIKGVLKKHAPAVVKRIEFRHG